MINTAMNHLRDMPPATDTRRAAVALLLIASSLLIGCRSSITHPGVIERARNLVEYTAEGTMGRDFYDERHYVGQSPVSELEADIASRYNAAP
jgi:hypothetical protein